MDKNIERLAKIGARRIVASEEPKKPGIPRRGQALVAAVTLSKEEIGDFDTRVSRVEVIELYGEEWNPRQHNPSIKRRIEKSGPKRIVEVLVTDAKHVVVCPHVAAQQKLAGSRMTEKKQAALEKNSAAGVKVWKKK